MERTNNLKTIFIIYLLGLLLGGLYVGMIAPVRLVIQSQFTLDDATGIWMINIYTLFYAACIPVVGKLADTHGRKPVFLECLATFAVGSLICGLSQMLNNYEVLLAGRLIQAVGACGVIPVANAEIGSTFPQEKRGMALGIAAAVAGLANVVGAAAGSLIIGLVGNENWSALFYFALPACALLILAGVKALPNRTVNNNETLDIPGSILMVITILLLLLALQDIDPSNLKASFCSPDVLLPIVGFMVFLIVFIRIERRAKSPVFHLEYMGNKPIVITMIVSFFIGCVTITMTLIPEVAEFIMNAPVGSGGLYILPVGVMCMFGPPLGGKLIDKMGPKPVLMSGLTIAALGFLMLAFASFNNGNIVVLIAGLSIMGLGMGFAMGAPTNYMILENTSPKESGSAIATIALVRQIGTTVAPAILLGFTTAQPGAEGFFKMLMCAAGFCLIALVCMIAYRKRV